jgi:outer membrane protein assembly factor BamB
MWLSNVAIGKLLSLCIVLSVAAASYSGTARGTFGEHQETSRTTAQDGDGLRTWTDESGKFRTEASFAGLKGTTVSLRLPDGRIIEVPLERLSRDDQRFARQAARAAKQRAEPTDGRSEPRQETDRSTADERLDQNTEGWYQWRGPNRDGISRETGLLKTWPPEGPPVLYIAEDLGRGYASVSVAGGRVFTMGKFGDETRLVALDAATGRKLWETPVGQGGDGPNGTPTVDGDLVYAISFTGELLCASVVDGSAVWRTSFSRDFGGKMMSTWGYSESPLVDGDRLVVSPGGPRAVMVALNKLTGEVIWQTALPANPGPAGQDGAGYSSIVVSEARGVRQYVQLVGRGLIGVDADSGELLWGYNRIANGTANVPTPLVSGDDVLCSSGYDDGGTALLRIKGSPGRLRAEEVWYKPSRELQNHHGGMVLIEGNVYMGHGHNNGFPVCFDLKTGRDRWRPGRGPGTGSAAVMYADGRLYFRYENGIMALIEANADDYFERGRFRIGIKHDQSWPHPVISDGRLYLRDQHQMIVYDIRDNT